MEKELLVIGVPFALGLAGLVHEAHKDLTRARQIYESSSPEFKATHDPPSAVQAYGEKLTTFKQYTPFVRQWHFRSGE